MIKPKEYILSKSNKFFEGQTENQLTPMTIRTLIILLSNLVRGDCTETTQN